MSRSRAGDSTSDISARITSDSSCDDSCSAISFMMARLSAGAQASIWVENRKYSGAPRPNAFLLTCSIQALTPAA